MAVTNVQLVAAATTAVDQYAPNAPEEVKVIAREMLIAFYPAMFQNRGVERIEFGDQQVEFSTRIHLGMQRSGAAEILSQWRRPRALSLSDA